jgi:hypothetical protein
VAAPVRRLEHLHVVRGVPVVVGVVIAVLLLAGVVTAV